MRVWIWGRGEGRDVRPRPAAGLGVGGEGGRGEAALGAAAHLGQVATMVAGAERVRASVVGRGGEGGGGGSRPGDSLDRTN